MGARSGKLIIPHDEQKTESSSKEANAPVEAISADQALHSAVNGSVIANADVPLIDAVESSPNKSDVGDTNAEVGDISGQFVKVDADMVEAADTVADTSAVTSDSTKTPKKSRNPFVWLHRRISRRRSRTSKKEEAVAVDAAENVAQDSPIAEGSTTVASDSVVQTAEAIVQEVVNAAVTTKTEEEEHRIPADQPVSVPFVEVSHKTEEIRTPSATVEPTTMNDLGVSHTEPIFESPATAPIPASPTEPMVNGGDHSCDQAIDEQPPIANEHLASVDGIQETNEHPVDGHFNVTDCHIAAKLASLEITNGLPVENHNHTQFDSNGMIDNTVTDSSMCAGAGEALQA